MFICFLSLILYLFLLLDEVCRNCMLAHASSLDKSCRFSLHELNCWYSAMVEKELSVLFLQNNITTTITLQQQQVNNKLTHTHIHTASSFCCMYMNNLFFTDIRKQVYEAFFYGLDCHVYFVCIVIYNCKLIWQKQFTTLNI